MIAKKLLPLVLLLVMGCAARSVSAPHATPASNVASAPRVVEAVRVPPVEVVHWPELTDVVIAPNQTGAEKEVSVFGYLGIDDKNGGLTLAVKRPQSTSVRVELRGAVAERELRPLATSEASRSAPVGNRAPYETDETLRTVFGGSAGGDNDCESADATGIFVEVKGRATRDQKDGGWTSVTYVVEVREVAYVMARSKWRSTEASHLASLEIARRAILRGDLVKAADTLEEAARSLAEALGPTILDRAEWYVFTKQTAAHLRYVIAQGSSIPALAGRVGVEYRSSGVMHERCAPHEADRALYEAAKRRTEPPLRALALRGPASSAAAHEAAILWWRSTFHRDSYFEADHATILRRYPDVRFAPLPHGRPGSPS